MVNIRSQVLIENRVEQSEDDRFSDNDDNVSVADHYRERYFGENDDDTMRSMERDRERLRTEQRFIVMNRQIGELTSIVRDTYDTFTSIPLSGRKVIVFLVFLNNLSFFLAKVPLVAIILFFRGSVQ